MQAVAMSFTAPRRYLVIKRRACNPVVTSNSASGCWTLILAVLLNCSVAIVDFFPVSVAVLQYVVCRIYDELLL